jgi:hypothetical protein
MALGRGQTTEVGAYANQRLNLAKLGRPMEEMPRFRTGPVKPGRPGLSGGPAKRSHGGIVNPSCNRKGKSGNPAPTAGARGFYPNQRKQLLENFIANSQAWNKYAHGLNNPSILEGIALLPDEREPATVTPEPSSAFLRITEFFSSCSPHTSTPKLSGGYRGTGLHHRDAA